MTCIVGVKHEGKVYLGGDSVAVSINYDITPRLDPKVFIVNNVMAIGFTDSFRMGQLLRYMTLPKHPEGMDCFQYMVTAIIPLIRKTFTDGGYNRKINGEDEGGFFLIGYCGHLYKIDEDYQVAEAAIDYVAIGCGRPYALGSLWHTKSWSPEDRINAALQVATYYSGAVAPPFNIVTV